MLPDRHAPTQETAPANAPIAARTFPSSPEPVVAAGGTERVHLKDAKQSSSEDIGARRTNSLSEVVETGAARSQLWTDEDDDLGIVNSNRPFIYRLTEQLWTEEEQELADRAASRDA